MDQLSCHPYTCKLDNVTCSEKSFRTNLDDEQLIHLDHKALTLDFSDAGHQVMTYRQVATRHDTHTVPECCSLPRLPGE